jgi:RNA polymerase sigma-70 factor (sigma-E family)
MTKGARVDLWGGDARYTRMIETHGESLLHLGILLTGNRSDAEDVVQDALIAVAAKWPRPESLAYLRRAVSNKAIDLIRSRREIATDEVPEVTSIERGYFRYEDDQRFFEMVSVLPTRQRAAIVMRYYADQDDRDIARALGCSVETVRSQVHRGLQKLRELETGGGDR